MASRRKDREVERREGGTDNGEEREMDRRREREVLGRRRQTDRDRKQKEKAALPDPH